ncbi:SRPBCC family protein [Nocardioides sp.]|uniref:SRPBCC family protein n=1 Tax=Nocardioides sp. TaxID=35761 RepID=UPI0035150BCF
MQVERSFVVPVAPEVVFDYLADFTATESWDPGTVSTVRTSGDGGLGTTYTNVSRFLGRKVTVRYTCITFDRPSHVVFRGRNGRATATDDLSFAPAETDDGVPGTRITYRATFDFGQPLNLLVPPLMRGRVEALADETVEALTTALLALPVTH